MKICIISTMALQTPPEAYGGAEWVAYLLAKGLAELGQEVTLIAARGSKAPEGVRLVEVADVGGLEKEKEAYDLYKDHLKEFEIIHDHSWHKWSYIAKAEDDRLKVISTTHGPNPYSSSPPVKFPNMCAVSNAHALFMSGTLGVPVRFVHNGIDLDMYPFCAEKGECYLSLNRIMIQKGIHVFVDLMRRLRVKGDVVGEDTKLIPDPSYVVRIQNLCDGFFVRYFGAVSNEQKLKLLQKAKATICLPLPPYMEVFGLAALESLAVGTPVIALRSGGLLEIVENGKSGFICDDVTSIETIIRENQAESIKPEDCRKRAEKFTYATMSKRCLGLYSDVIAGKEW